MVYSEFAQDEFYLNTHNTKTAVQEAIKNVVYMGSFTNTSGGLRHMKDIQFTSARGDRSNVPNIAIVITDGVSNRDTDRTIPDAEAARANGVKIFSVGITNLIDEDELRLMASLPQEINKQYFTTPSFNMLGNILDTIVAQTCITSPPDPVVTTQTPAGRIYGCQSIP